MLPGWERTYVCVHAVAKFLQPQLLSPSAVCPIAKKLAAEKEGGSDMLPFETLPH